MTVLAHGTVQRWDAGCNCPDCTRAHTTMTVRRDKTVRTVAANETLARAMRAYHAYETTEPREGLTDQSWRQDASCVGMDQRLFFPERGDPTRQAKTICAGCPVRADCLDEALTAEIRHGIWGGRSENERRHIRHERRTA